MRILVIFLVFALVTLVTGKRDKKGCKYIKGEWGECDASTNEMKRTWTLKEIKDGCEPSKEQTRPCKKKVNKNCKYNKSEWGECGAVTKDKVARTLTLRHDEPGCEQTLIQTMSCEKFQLVKERKEAKKRWKAEKRLIAETYKKLEDLKNAGCLFEEVVSDCNHGNYSDPETQMAKRTFNLISGDATMCIIDPLETLCKMEGEIRRIQQKMEKMRKRRERKEKRKNKKVKNNRKLKNRKEMKQKRKQRQ